MAEETRDAHGGNTLVAKVMVQYRNWHSCQWDDLFKARDIFTLLLTDVWSEILSLFTLT
jgi:hypothetical protein